MQVFGLITARGGSKGLPGKNIRSFCGKPLVAWTVEAALQAKRIDRVLISTDDEEIAAAAKTAGCEVPFMRPDELAADEATHADVLKHFEDWLKSEDLSPDYIMTLQPTTPLRNATDIDNAIDLAEKHDALAVVGVHEVSYTSRPFMARFLRDDGTLERYQDLPAGARERRQDTRSFWATNGSMYLNRSKELFEDFEFMPDGTVPYFMPSHRSLDIDSITDFRLNEIIHAHLDGLNSL